MSRYARDPISGSILPIAGGGGGGGHTIVNESGTELTQRSKLQFKGASVTDDETNDTTVVEIENDVNLDIIAPTEVSPSTHAYEVGKQFIYNDNLYTATSNIAVGDSIVPEGSTPTVVGAITLYEQATTPTGITKVVIDDVEYTTFSNMPVKEGSHVVFYHDSTRSWYFDPYDSSTYIGNRDLGVGEACYFDVPTGISGTLTLYVYPFTNNDITYDTLSLEPSQGWGEKKEEVIPALGEGSYTPITFNCTLSPTIADQLDDKVEVVDYEEDIYGVNLIPYPYFSPNERVTNGITFTVNADLSITANGTATADALFMCANRNPSYDSGIKLDIGTSYILTGCPSGGSDSTYFLRSNYAVNGVAGIAGTDAGNGAEFEAIEVDNPGYGVYITIVSGTTVNNLTFHPMLRKATIKDDTYRPYNQQSIQHQLTDQTNVLGAKNLIPYPYISTTKTQAGITFTDNGNGLITANAASATTGAVSFVLWRGGEDALPKGEYILSDSGESSDNVYVAINKENATGAYIADLVRLRANTHEVKFNIDYNGYSHVGIQIYARAGATASNLVFHPMLRLASDPDNTYQPYAMTNRELTEDVQTHDSLIAEIMDTLVPVGTIISVMANNAPTGYLICDGTTYNISAYQRLANHFNTEFGSKNKFGGDGTTTFAVPDLRGEFLRGTGTTSRTTDGSGSGAAVGTHQKPTTFPLYQWGSGSDALYFMSDSGGILSMGNYDGSYNYRTGTHVYRTVYTSTTSSTGNTYDSISARPCNTSVLYCIKY